MLCFSLVSGLCLFLLLMPSMGYFCDCNYSWTSLLFIIIAFGLLKFGLLTVSILQERIGHSACWHFLSLNTETLIFVKNKQKQKNYKLLFFNSSTPKCQRQIYILSQITHQSTESIVGSIVSMDAGKVVLKGDLRLFHLNLIFLNLSKQCRP